jgi:atypical dual specificity phosphatase
MHLKTFNNGFKALFGAEIDKAAEEARAQLGLVNPLKHPFHISLVTRKETASTLYPIDEERLIEDVKFLGIGQGSTSRWIVVLCPSANRWRVRCGLPLKDFHISLTDTQDTNLNKSIDSLFQTFDPSPSVLFALVQHYSLSKPFRAYEFALQLCTVEPIWEKSWLALANSSVSLDYHSIAMLAYAHLYNLSSSPKQQQKIIEAILLAGRHVLTGAILSEPEAQNAWNTLDKTIQEILASPWPVELRVALRDAALPRLLDLQRTPQVLHSPAIGQSYRAQRFFVSFLPRF